MKRLECDTCEELCEHPQAICLAKNELIAEDKAQRVADLFKILGDTTRVKIIQALSKRELCVCDIAAVIGMADDLRMLPFTIRLSRDALAIIRQNITFSLAIKLIAVLAVFPGWLTLWLAILADMGASIIVTLNSLRLLRVKPK